jgi:hypothetical protein
VGVVKTFHRFIYFIIRFQFQRMFAKNKNAGLVLTISLLMLPWSIARAQGTADVGLRREVSQYGITWTFDKPMRTGRFISGDWWVLGPVRIIKVSPAPGPASIDTLTLKVNRWNDTSLKNDTTLRNGSMIVLKAGHKQSYDSRAAAFSKEEVVKFPLTLNASLSLISSISNDTLPVDHFAKNIMWDAERKSETVMKAAAVLTCVDKVPPADAFRPPYAGINKPFFTASAIRWERLPRLAPAGEVPSWSEFERYLQRPWIDHLMSWSQQQLVPNENGPNYGREHARIISIASAMIALDVPTQQKQKLTIGLIQRGIDLYGLAMAGGYWNEGGGHSSGRKWPIVFASIMLNEPAFNNLPETAIFQEDTQTYYGKGWFGQDVLWQMIQHHGQRSTYEEKPPKDWEQWDKTSESYRTCCTGSSWVGMALIARHMKAIKSWNHDAFFDYVDRWMREDDPYAAQRSKSGRPKAETTTFDPFVTSMWKAHRKSAPEQEKSGNPKKFIWVGKKGTWVDNPR